MLQNAIAWNLKEDDHPRPWTFEQKVEIFRERVDGWQLWIAHLIANGGDDLEGARHEKIPHSGFAVLLIVMSYFEMIARYIEGDRSEDRPGDFFRKGVRAVIPTLDKEPDQTAVSNLLTDWYKQVRCGLYHAAQVRAGVGLTGDIHPSVFWYDTRQRLLLINPHTLAHELRVHLRDYCIGLRDPSTSADLKANFERRFDYDIP